MLKEKKNKIKSMYRSRNLQLLKRASHIVEFMVKVLHYSGNEKKNKSGKTGKVYAQSLVVKSSYNQNLTEME